MIGMNTSSGRIPKGIIVEGSFPLIFFDICFEMEFAR